jgi:hypothetical protein
MAGAELSKLMTPASIRRELNVVRKSLKRNCRMPDFFTAVFHAVFTLRIASLPNVNTKPPMLPRWSPPHQEIRCVRQDIFGQDYCSSSTLEAAAQFL